MALPFEFIIDGPPVSQQTRRRERLREWIEEVRRVATQAWPVGELPVTGPVSLTITYFYTLPMDVDNIPKPIADALAGLVYVSDDQVTDLVCRKRDLTSELRIAQPSSVLADGLNRGNEFLYIHVADASAQEVSL